MTVVSKLSLRNFQLCRTICSWEIRITFSTMCYPEYQTAYNPKLKLHFQTINSNSASYKDKLKTNRCVCASVERTAFLPRKARLAFTQALTSKSRNLFPINNQESFFSP